MDAPAAGPSADLPASALHDAIDDLIARIRPPGAAAAGAVRRHLDDLTKPPGSLGSLEDIACRLACILGDPPGELRPRGVLVLAGDHGVTAAGVSAYPAEVTVQMCHNIADGGAAVSVLARQAGADVVVADLGVARPVEHPDVQDCNVVRGTADLSRTAAMSPEQVRAAIAQGAALVEERLAACRLIAIGEMGIGNTTAAAALSAALLDAPAARVVGPGTGVRGPELERKREVVERALTRLPAVASPLQALAELGGAEIAGMVGSILAGAATGRVVVLDGFISTVAGLVAARLAPSCVDYLIASHRSPEPGHALLLDALGLAPLLDLGLRLGEGSGAVLAIPLLDAAAALLREMATCSSAGISGPRSGPAAGPHPPAGDANPAGSAGPPAAREP